MLLAARLLEHALVGDLVQDVVLEDELARALEGARLAAVGELAPRQAVERGAAPPGRCAAAPRPRRRGRSRSPAAAPSSRPAAGCRCAPAGRRRASTARARRAACRPRRATARSSVTMHAVVDQHADQLLDEVRVAFGAAREQVAQRRRARSRAGAAAPRSARACRASRAARGRCAGGRSGRCPRAAAARTASTASGRAGTAAGRRSACDQVVDEVERAFVGPVQVVEQEHDRRRRCRDAGRGSTTRGRGRRDRGSAWPRWRSRRCADRRW